MAALSMGAFGTYKQSYFKYLKELKEEEPNANYADPNVETVWVTKRYIPTDLRVIAPVPRHKLVAPKQLPQAGNEWMPVMDAPLRSHERREEVMAYTSRPSTRSEEWSTLRQILPSHGEHRKTLPSNWGTGSSLPPIWMSGDRLMRFPKVNSPMVRYIDNMHTADKLFIFH